MKPFSQKLSQYTLVWSLVAMIVLTACQPQDYTASLKPLADQYLNAWNSGDYTGLDDIIHQDFVRTGTPTSNSSAEGLDSLKSVIDLFRGMFPDLNVVINSEIYTENTAISQWTVTATNTGPGAFPPTGRTINIGGTSIFKFSDGKIISDIAQFDNLNFMSQLGYALVPPAGQLENDPTVVDSDHYTVAMENERVRVLSIKYGPGEKSVMHDHFDGVVIFLDDAQTKFTLSDGSTIDASGKARDVIWAPGGAHLPENISDKAFEVILVELKTQ